MVPWREKHRSGGVGGFSIHFPVSSWWNMYSLVFPHSLSFSLLIVWANINTSVLYDDFFFLAEENVSHIKPLEESRDSKLKWFTKQQVLEIEGPRDRWSTWTRLIYYLLVVSSRYNKLYYLYKMRCETKYFGLVKPNRERGWWDNHLHLLYFTLISLFSLCKDVSNKR